MIVIVSWAIENNLVYLSVVLVGSMSVNVFWSYPLVNCNSFLVLL